MFLKRHMIFFVLIKTSDSVKMSYCFLFITDWISYRIIGLQRLINVTNTRPVDIHVVIIFSLQIHQCDETNPTWIWKRRSNPVWLGQRENWSSCMSLLFHLYGFTSLFTKLVSMGIAFHIANTELVPFFNLSGLVIHCLFLAKFM